MNAGDLNIGGEGRIQKFDPSEKSDISQKPLKPLDKQIQVLKEKIREKEKEIQKPVVVQSGYSKNLREKNIKELNEIKQELKNIKNEKRKVRENLKSIREGLKIGTKQLEEKIKKHDENVPKSKEVVSEKGIPQEREIEKKQKVKKMHEAPAVLGVSSTISESMTGRTDLKTAQGEKAELLSAKVNGCLISGLANANEVSFEKIIPNSLPSPKEQFLSVIRTIEGFLSAADLGDTTLQNKINSNPNYRSLGNCAMLNDLAGLLHKGFNASIGGVGSFNQEGWKPEWNKIGREKEYSFAPGNENNEKAKESLLEMLDYFKKNANVHFGDTRHVAGRELASVQVAGTIGQLFNDFVFKGDYEEESRLALASLMEKSNLIHSSMKPTVENALPVQVKEILTTLRSSPLLAEVSNTLLSNEIANKIKEGDTYEEMEALIVKELRELDKGEKLDEKQLKELASAVLENFAEGVETMQHRTPATGSRGRLAFDRTMKGFEPLGKNLAGEKGIVTSVAVQPNRSHDRISDEWVKETLGESPKIKELFKAIEGDQKIFKMGGSPTNPLRLGQGLDSGIAALLNSKNSLLKAAIEETLKQVQDPKSRFKKDISDELYMSQLSSKISVLEGLEKNLENKSFNQEYQKIIGDIKVTFNSATKQKIKLNDFAEMKSVAGIMLQNDVRTICSISGTTVDIILAQCAVLGEEEVKKLLEPLLNQLEGKEPGLNSPEGLKFKEFATAIGAFMQVGKYHSMGEVLGGLFIAARSLNSSSEQNIDVKTTFKEFERLMKNFAHAPERFISVGKFDAGKIRNRADKFLDKVTLSDKQQTHLHMEQMKGEKPRVL